MCDCLTPHMCLCIFSLSVDWQMTCFNISSMPLSDIVQSSAMVTLSFQQCLPDTKTCVALSRNFRNIFSLFSFVSKLFPSPARPFLSSVVAVTEKHVMLSPRLS